MNGLIIYAWKEKGIASHDQRTSEERSTYFTFSEIQISPIEEMEVSSLFLTIKAKLTATTFHQQEKKMKIKFVMHRVKIYLNGSSLFSFYQGMLRTMKMSFYKRKISWDLCHFAYPTESFSMFRTENYVVFSFKQAYNFLNYLPIVAF